MGEMRLKMKVPAKKSNRRKGIKKGDLIFNPAVAKFERILKQQGLAYDAYFGIDNKSLGEGEPFVDSHFLCPLELKRIEEAYSSFVVWESYRQTWNSPKPYNAEYYNDGKFNLKAQDQQELVIFIY